MLNPVSVNDTGYPVNINPQESPSEILNVTASCAVRTIEDPVILTPYSTTLTTTVRSLQAFFYIVILLLAIFLNILVIVLVAKFKKLQTRTNFVALQIIVLNLLLTSSVYLIRPITAIADKWVFGEHVCIISAYVYLIYTSIRFFLMLIFAVDRFLAVFFSFSYPKFSSRMLLTASIFTWCACIVFRGMVLPWWLDCFAHISTFHLCVFFVHCSQACFQYGIASVALLYAPAVVFPTVIFIILHCKARRVKRRNNSESSIRKLHEREWKPTVLFILLFISASALIIPHHVSIISIYNAYVVPPAYFHVFLAVLQIVASCPVIVDPIIMLRDRDFKDVMLDVYVKMRQKRSGIGNQTEENEEIAM